MISQKHKKFADEYLSNGFNVVPAYQSVYPKAADRSARTKGGELLQKVDIKAYIKARQDIIQKKSDELLGQKMAEQDVGSLLTAAKKRSILAKIANGEFEYEDLIVIRGEVKKIRRKPTPNEIAKAIEIDNRMTGDERPQNELEGLLKIEGKKLVIKQTFKGII